MGEQPRPTALFGGRNGGDEEVRHESGHESGHEWGVWEQPPQRSHKKWAGTHLHGALFKAEGQSALTVRR